MKKKNIDRISPKEIKQLTDKMIDQSADQLRKRLRKAWRAEQSGVEISSRQQLPRYV